MQIEHLSFRPFGSQQLCALDVPRATGVRELSSSISYQPSVLWPPETDWRLPLNCIHFWYHCASFVVLQNGQTLKKSSSTWTLKRPAAFSAWGHHWCPPVLPKDQKKKPNISRKHVYCLLLLSFSQSNPLFFYLQVFLEQFGPFLFTACDLLAAWLYRPRFRFHNDSHAAKTSGTEGKNGLMRANLSGWPHQNHKDDMKIREITEWIGGLAPKKMVLES